MLNRLSQSSDGFFPLGACDGMGVEVLTTTKGSSRIRRTRLADRGYRFEINWFWRLGKDQEREIELKSHGYIASLLTRFYHVQKNAELQSRFNRFDGAKVSGCIAVNGRHCVDIVCNIWAINVSEPVNPSEFERLNCILATLEIVVRDDGGKHLRPSDAPTHISYIN